MDEATGAAAWAVHDHHQAVRRRQAADPGHLLLQTLHLLENQYGELQMPDPAVTEAGPRMV